MKLHQFGLWFNFWGYNSMWRRQNAFGKAPAPPVHQGLSTTIPQSPGFTIYYDGVRVGAQYLDFSLRIVRTPQPNLLKLKVMAPPKNGGIILDFDRLLTLQDFEIIPNPAYKE